MTSSLVLLIAFVGSGACPGSGYPGPCPEDVDRDGTVGTSDLIAVIQGWGFNPCSRADVDGNREVNVGDLVAVITQYGPCPPASIVNISGCDPEDEPYCRVLDQPFTTYVLQEDLSPTGDCFLITENDIILEGNGKTITGNDFNDCVNAVGRERLVIRNLTIIDFARGVDFDGTDDSLVEGNSFESILAHAVLLAGGSDRNTIRDNLVNGATQSGVRVNLGDDNVIKCNEIHDSGFGYPNAGVALRAPQLGFSLRNTIADNTMTAGVGTMADGIILLRGSNETCVIGNTVINANFDAMEINSDNNHVQDNVVDFTVEDGDTITVRGGASGNTFVDNVIRGGHNGYRLNDTHDSVIMGGSVEGTGMTAGAAAILVVGPCSGITIDSVTILDSLAEDLKVGAPISNFHFIDMVSIGSYTIAEARGLAVEHSTHGLIVLAPAPEDEPVRGSGDAFSSDIQIAFNSAIVDSASGLNRPADITLLGLPDFTDPVICRNGELCPQNVCGPLFFDDGTAQFHVQSWTEYRIAEGTCP